MNVRWLFPLRLSLALPIACSSSDAAPAPTQPVYDRLGKAEGVEAVVKDFLARVTADSKINGYFLNSSLDTARLSSCLVKQIGSATGGPERYDCRGMKEAHANLGISKQDFDDLVGHLTAALEAAKVDQKDIDTIVGVLAPMEKDIVEDATNDGTIYQRIGRKPAIESVVTAFHAKVMADQQINHFFTGRDVSRLATCLVRQVCEATGGPCMYGKKILADNPDAGLLSPCRSMKESHAGLKIAKADFDELVSDLVGVIDDAGVATADRDAIVGVLGPMCPDVVETGTCQ